VVGYFRGLQEGNRDFDFKGVNLPPKSVALDLHIHQTKQRLIATDFFGKQDRAGARAPDGLGFSKGADGLQELICDHQLPDGS